MPRSTVLPLLACAAVGLMLAGCPRGGDPAASSGGTATAENGTVETVDVAAVFDDSLLDDPLRGLELPEIPTETIPRDGFEPPETLEALLDAHDWEDGPVSSGLERLRKIQPDEPLIPIGQAVGMPNDSPEANEKLLSAFGIYPESEDEVDYDARFTMHFASDAKTTNPLLISSKYDQELVGFIGVGLFGFDYALDLYADEAAVSQWRRSTDRLVDVITIRDDLTWSDGEPITAYDVEFSYDTIMDPEIPIYAVRSGTDELLDVVAYDDRTVAFFHEASKATNTLNAGFTLIPKHTYEKTIAADKTLVTSDEHIALEEQPVVGGPYEIVQRQAGQRTVLRRRESWFMHDGEQVRPKPHFAEVECRVISDLNTALLALKNGDLDYMEVTPQQWDSQTEGDDFYSRCTKLAGEGWSFSCVMYNTESPYFRDRAVRRAIGFAFDHAEFLDTIAYGLYRPGQGPAHPDSWYAPSDAPGPLTQDLDEAERLLDEAGWDDSDGDGVRDKDGVELSFTIMFGTGSDTSQAIAELLTESLDQIGIEVNPKSTEFVTIQERARKGEFDAVVMGWGAGADPDTGKNLWMSDQIPTDSKPDGRNFARIRSDAIDELYERGIYEFDRERRGQIYGRVSALLWQEQPYMFIGYRPELVGLSNAMRGAQFSPRGMIGYGGGFEGLWKPKQ